MNGELDIREEEGFLRAVLPDYKDSSGYMSHADAILARCEKIAQNRILVDATALTALIPVLQLYEIGTYMAKQIEGRYIRAAVIANPEQIYPDRFFETVARNRGMDLRVFTSSVEAQAWLTLHRSKAEKKISQEEETPGR